MIASFTVPEPTQNIAARDLYRKVGNSLELTRVDREQDGYGAPDPKRYKLILSGMSDVFEEDGKYGRQEKVICEFMVVGSKKWEGTRFSCFYTWPNPNAWTNDRTRLALLAGALMGKALPEKDDKIDFQTHILNETVFEGIVELVTSEKGFQYPKIATHLALDPDDDDAAPVTPRQRAIASDDEFPE